jgi:hypothetical protein
MSMLSLRGIGMGELVPGRYNVPFNTVSCGCSSGAAQNGMGEMTPALFAIPENPIMRAGKMMPASLSPTGLSGLGDFSLPDLSGISTWISSQSSTTWIVVGVGVVAFMLLSRGSGSHDYKQDKADALRRLREKYPTRVTRARRAITAYQS